jgi:hypothetical protein
MAERLDDLLDSVLSAWLVDELDERTLGEVIRAVLTDPANRPLVSSWLATVGLRLVVPAGPFGWAIEVDESEPVGLGER